MNSTPTSKPSRARSFNIDDLIDRIVEHARRWTDDGHDTDLDGLEQFRAGLYPIFGIPPPPGEQAPS